MDRGLWANAFLASALWIGLVVGLVGQTVLTDGAIWTVSSSDKVASHPTLVRASYQMAAASLPRPSGR